MFDFSTLPRVRTHSQLAAVGDSSNCSIWNPFTYGDCINTIRNARTEMANMLFQQQSLVLSWQNLQNEIYNTWQDDAYKSSALAEINANLQASQIAMSEVVATQNEFEASLEPYKNIPFFSTIFLSGLGADPITIGGATLYGWALIIGGTLIVTSIAAWGISRSVAAVAKSNADKARYNQFVERYKACAELAKQGMSCDSLPAPSDVNEPGGINLDSWIFWAVGGLLVFVLVRNTLGRRAVYV